LVNYIRSEAKNGNIKPDVSSFELFQDDKYLQPVLEDDALLFCLDELVEPETQTTQSQERQPEPGIVDSNSKIQELEQRLAQIQSEHAEYRKRVEEILEKRWEENEPASQKTVEDAKAGLDKDKDYFDSYSYSGKLSIDLVCKSR
jgi:protein arginine N-methyltransferase 3